MSPPPLSGEYFFRRHEMVAGFRFSDDGAFDFFYSYGAVDRFASGTFVVEDNVLKLNSRKEPGKDFTILRQGRQGRGYHIIVKDPNRLLVNNVKCIFFVGEDKYEDYTGSNGEIHVDAPHCDRIFVQHALFPDIATLVKDAGNQHNYFELALNPSLEQVSFQGIDFFVSGDVLTCHANYFMPLVDIEFIKSSF